MKIVIVSGDFYPNNSPRSFRTTELVKQFSKLGHEVTIYIPRNNKDYGDFIKKYPAQIKYYDVKSGLSGNSLFTRILSRLLSMFLEYPDSSMISSIKDNLKRESGYDLLITIAMPHPIHWALGKLYDSGCKIAKTWIADCGDPYMLCGTNRIAKPFYFRSIEKLWCRKCSYISVPTEDAKNGYYPEFRDKIRVIPQGFDFTEVKIQEYKRNDIPTFVFSGNIIPHVRDPRPLLDYLSGIDRNFKFIFYSTKHHLLNPYKERMGDRLEIHGYIPRLDLLYVLSGADFLVNIKNATSVQTPSKLIDYSLTRRPILSVDPQNLDTAVIDEFLDGNYAHQFKVKDVEQYNIINVANKFLNLTNN